MQHLRQRCIKMFSSSVLFWETTLSVDEESLSSMVHDKFLSRSIFYRGSPRKFMSDHARTEFLSRPRRLRVKRKSLERSLFKTIRKIYIKYSNMLDNLPLLDLRQWFPTIIHHVENCHCYF